MIPWLARHSAPNSRRRPGHSARSVRVYEYRLPNQRGDVLVVLITGFRFGDAICCRIDGQTFTTRNLVISPQIHAGVLPPTAT